MQFLIYNIGIVIILLPKFLCKSNDRMYVKCFVNGTGFFGWLSVAWNVENLQWVCCYSPVLLSLTASLMPGPQLQRLGPEGEIVWLICFALTVLNEKLFRFVLFLLSLLSLGNYIFLRVLLMESTEPNSLKFNLAAWVVSSPSTTLPKLIHPHAGVSAFVFTIMGFHPGLIEGRGCGGNWALPPGSGLACSSGPLPVSWLTMTQQN